MANPAYSKVVKLLPAKEQVINIVNLNPPGLATNLSQAYIDHCMNVFSHLEKVIGVGKVRPFQGQLIWQRMGIGYFVSVHVDPLTPEYNNSTRELTADEGSIETSFSSKLSGIIFNIESNGATVPALASALLALIDLKVEMPALDI